MHTFCIYFGPNDSRNLVGPTNPFMLCLSYIVKEVAKRAPRLVDLEIFSDSPYGNCRVMQGDHRQIALCFDMNTNPAFALAQNYAWDQVYGRVPSFFLRMARERTEAWLYCGLRLGLTRDMRLMIGRLVFHQRCVYPETPFFS